tara:strand:+ start:253 stop:492 length:240 start_codon:yes stop_codon:yes gene_type:complete
MPSATEGNSTIVGPMHWEHNAHVNAGFSEPDTLTIMGKLILPNFSHVNVMGMEIFPLASMVPFLPMSVENVPIKVECSA